MSTANLAGSTITLADREHTWADEKGQVYSTLDLGSFFVTFDDAAEARQVAARCLAIADAIDAKTAELAAARTETTP